MTTTKRWEFLGRAARGEHKFFYEIATGKVAVADNSGDTPETTDDGVLYLDEAGKIAISRGGLLLPLLDAQGRSNWTPLGANELAWIVATWPGLWPTAEDIKEARV